MTQQDLVEIQEALENKFDNSKSQISKTETHYQGLDAMSNVSPSQIGRMDKSPRAQLSARRTADGLRKYDSREDIHTTPDRGPAEDEIAEFNKLLKELNLPLEICDIIAGMPEEVRAYIMDEIIEEALARKCVVAEKAAEKSIDYEKTRLSSLIKKKEKEVYADNFRAIKKNKDLELTARKIELETAEAQN